MGSSNKYLECDVAVIGCGIAGCTAAIHLARSGLDVLLVTRTGVPTESSTYYAQGGIIYRKGKDDSSSLIEDILNAGGHYNNIEAVRILAEEGPDLIKKFLIDDIGVLFDRTGDDDLSLIREGAHSRERIIHREDTTGKSIESALIKRIKTLKNVRILTDHTAVDLLTTSHHGLDKSSLYRHPECVGVYCLDNRSGKIIRCLSKVTILATGGLGRIYHRTSNPPGIRGDGLAMAYKSGARIINCEFVQFHPTTFYRTNAPSFLLSEALRGAGARLVGWDGKPFMKKYDAQWGDLAPRDIVSRSIHQEILASGHPNVYLDLASTIPEETIRSRFPSIYSQCLHYGVDITRDLIPTVPAAHYFCGGIWVDLNGRTSLSNLYAVGEVSCSGVHGANRIASSSLLEGLVWGKRAAEDISELIHTVGQPNPGNIPPWEFSGEELPDLALISQDLNAIQHIMWNYVGLVRTTARLERALNDLNNLQVQIERFYRRTLVTDELIGLRNAVVSALLVTRAAYSNRKSIGCHYRS